MTALVCYATQFHLIKPIDQSFKLTVFRPCFFSLCSCPLPPSDFFRCELDDLDSMALGLAILSCIYFNSYNRRFIIKNRFSTALTYYRFVLVVINKTGLANIILYDSPMVAVLPAKIFLNRCHSKMISPFVTTTTTALCYNPHLLT